MSMTSRIAEEQAMRAIIVRLLRERADATPSDIVELLGEYVIWGPPEGHPTSQVSVQSGDAVPTFVAA
jgi:hypothetical protein